jgi:hypothetical protein
MVQTAPVVLAAPATDPVVLEHAVVVQATFELAGLGRDPLLPPGLAPTVPTLLTFLSVQVPDGPFGRMSFAQARLSCRSGVRARALVVASEVEATSEVVERLARGWGLGGRPGSVGLHRRYDRVTVEVPAWGLVLAIADPSPIGAGDVQYVAGLHPVTTSDGASRLAQVELDVVLERAERGRPELVAYDGLLVGGQGPPSRRAEVGPPSRRVKLVQPARPVAATVGAGTFTLPRIRYLLDPELPPHLGTTAP